ncbi:MAG: lactate utilization protein C, partial [Burkholderiaceae bacterium]
MSLDTEKARAEIMQRIRTNQRRGAITPEQRAAAADYLTRHSQGPRPPTPSDLLTAFRATAERMASTVELIEHASQAPAAVARYLSSKSLGAKAVAWPSLASLPWAGSGVEVEFRPPRRDESQGADMVGITGCFCA